MAEIYLPSPPKPTQETEGQGSRSLKARAIILKRQAARGKRLNERDGTKEKTLKFIIWFFSLSRATMGAGGGNFPMLNIFRFRCSCGMAVWGGYETFCGGALGFSLSLFGGKG